MRDDLRLQIFIIVCIAAFVAILPVILNLTRLHNPVFGGVTQAIEQSAWAAIGHESAVVTHFEVYYDSDDDD